MNKPSISELLEDSPPITQADIDAGRLILRQRQQGRILPFKQRVNIYLDREIVEHFKQRAGGRGYQTLLNETLKQAIQQEHLEDTLRRVIREELQGQPEVMCRGGSVVVGPLGDVIAGPLWDEEGILYAEINLDEVVKSKLDFDVVGHYGMRR